MTIKLWTYNYPTSLDTNTQYPTIENRVDKTDASQINSLASSSIQLQNIIGSNLLEVGSVRATLTNLSASHTSITSSFTALSSSYISNSTYIKYLDLTLPSTVTASIDGLWQFDNTVSRLTDRTANGHNWTLNAGTSCSGSINVFYGLGFNNSSYYKCDNSSSLKYQNDFTWEIQTFKYIGYGTANAQTFLAYGGNSTTEATNVQYLLQSNITTGQIYHLSEHDASLSDAYTSNILMMPTIQLLTYIRKNNIIYIYLDGILMANSGLLNAPTGGASANLYLGAGVAGTNLLEGVIFSMRAFSYGFSAAEVLESYKKTKGML